MTDSATVLRRKLAPSRPSSVPGASSVEAMLRLVLPREADEALSMDLFVTSVSNGTQNKKALLDGIELTDLVYLMEQGEMRGLCKVSPGLLAALTEIQMSGRVTSAEPPERTPTRTDGIVAGDIIDRWMSTAETVAAEGGILDALPFAAFQRRNIVLNRRNADLSIDPGVFRTLEIEMSLGGDAKSGRLFFAVPQADTESSAASQKASQLRRHLPQVEAHLRAVLVRLPVKVERVQKLAVGDLLDIPIESLTDMRLEGLDGRLIAPARLGQLNGAKAVRLSGSGVSKPKPMLAAPEATIDAPGDVPAATDPPADLPELPALPDLPEAGEGALPELPALPDSDGLTDLPDLPDLPALPDLPSGQ